MLLKSVLGVYFLCLIRVNAFENDLFLETAPNSSTLMRSLQNETCDDICYADEKCVECREFIDNDIVSFFEKIYDFKQKKNPNTTCDDILQIFDLTSSEDCDAFDVTKTFNEVLKCKINKSTDIGEICPDIIDNGSPCAKEEDDCQNDPKCISCAETANTDILESILYNEEMMESGTCSELKESFQDVYSCDVSNNGAQFQNLVICYINLYTKREACSAPTDEHPCKSDFKACYGDESCKNCLKTIDIDEMSSIDKNKGQTDGACSYWLDQFDKNFENGCYPYEYGTSLNTLLLCLINYISRTSVCDDFSSTLEPSNSPTTSPTPNPTMEPTLNPTSNPTLSPTIAPTSNPTLNPTLNPTIAPTSNPTLNPTFNPTNAPIHEIYKINCSSLFDACNFIAHCSYCLAEYKGFDYFNAMVAVYSEYSCQDYLETFQTGYGAECNVQEKGSMFYFLNICIVNEFMMENVCDFEAR